VIRVIPEPLFVQRIHTELTRVRRSTLRYGHQDDQPGSPETLRGAMETGTTGGPVRMQWRLS